MFTKADYIASYIAEKKASGVFQLSGGMIAFLADAIFRLNKTPIYNLRHEQAAGFAAEGASRVSGISHVALGTSGPGATNLITSIASSYFDSVPTIYITGQVNQKELRKNLKQRQNGFQELDIVEMVTGITKFAVRLNSNSNLREILDSAWSKASAGRPGPVLIDIPIDVQQEPYEVTECDSQLSESKVETQVENGINCLNELLRNSSKPIILLGGGIRSADCTELVRSFVKTTNLPAVYSLMAVDVLPNECQERIGLIGTYGNRWANMALNEADLVIALGTRLDIRQTGEDVSRFVKGKEIFRVDIDSYELVGRLVADYSVHTDLKTFMKESERIKVEKSIDKWIQEIKQFEVDNPQEHEQTSPMSLNPNALIKTISGIFSDSEGFVVDVGQHQMWAAQSMIIQSRQRFLTSGGLGAMGFSLPAAIGASVTSQGYWVVVLGDGCAQLSLAEFQTVKQYSLPLVIVVINNLQHGMVAQFQDGNLGGRHIGTRVGYSVPNFSKLGEAFGIESYRVINEEDLFQVNLDKFRKNPSPLLIEVIMSQEAKALPKMGTLD